MCPLRYNCDTVSTSSWLLSLYVDNYNDGVRPIPALYNKLYTCIVVTPLVVICDSTIAVQNIACVYVYSHYTINVHTQVSINL